MLQQPTQISFQMLEGFLDSAWVLAAYQALNSSTGLQSECSAILVLFKESKYFTLLWGEIAHQKLTHFKRNFLKYIKYSNGVTQH